MVEFNVRVKINGVKRTIKGEWDAKTGEVYYNGSLIAVHTSLAMARYALEKIVKAAVKKRGRDGANG